MFICFHYTDELAYEFIKTRQDNTDADRLNADYFTYPASIKHDEVRKGIQKKSN